jgi:hypothetical protein
VADSKTDKQLIALVTLARAIPGKLLPPPRGIRITPDRERYRTALGRVVSRLVLAAYKAGEMDLVQALNVVHRCAVGSDQLTRILGEAAAGGLALGEPKLLNRRKPAYPAWLKRFAVDLVDRTQKQFPQMPLSTKDERVTSVLQFTVRILAANNLCPMPPRPDRRARGDHGNAGALGRNATSMVPRSNAEGGKVRSARSTADKQIIRREIDLAPILFRGGPLYSRSVS